MECTDIQKYFSEYIDDRLSDKKKTVVKDHLETCQACKEELAALKKTVDRVRDLPKVNAPEKFLFQLNERLEPHSGFKKILQQMVACFRFKIPFGFATATAVAVLIIFVIQIEQRKNPPTAPKTETPVADKMNHVGGQRTAIDETPMMKSPAELPSAVSAPMSDMNREKMAVVDQKKKKAYRNGQKDLDTAAVAPVQKKKEGHQNLVWELAIENSFRKGQNEVPALSAKEAQQPGFASGKSGFLASEKELSSDLLKDEAIDVEEDVKLMNYGKKEAFIKEIEGSAKQVGGTVVSREEEVISLAIPAANIAELYKKLSHFGQLNISREEVLDYQQGQDPVVIQIILTTKRVGDHYE